MSIIKADLVLKNGKIFLGQGQGFAQALAVWGGKILASGSDGDIDALVGTGTRVIDLAGRTAIPGVNDAHQHMLSLGLAQLEIDLRAEVVSTLDELLREVKAKADQVGPGEWIVGGRYDHFALDVNRQPYREELDQVAPDNPVLLVRTCGHIGVANSKALELAGIDEDTKDPPGGHLVRENGRLTGELQETAKGLVQAAMPDSTLAELVEGLEAGGDLLLSYGITSVMDAGVGFKQDYLDLIAYQEARRQGRLKVRSYLSLTGGPSGIAGRAYDNGLLTGFGDEFLKIGSVKLFTDGSAGGRTAAMNDPYQCNCGNRGLFIYEDAEIFGYVEEYHRKGYQVSMHAIGDAAIDQGLRALEAAQSAHPSEDRRHRIEHCSFTTPEQIETMRRLGALPAPQPIFIYEFGDLYVDVLGEARPASSYPMRSWIDAGLRPSASSDTPVSDFNPFKNLYAMVTRKTNRGTTLGAGEAIGMEEAVHALTMNGAYGSFSERRKGDLSVGMLADIAVLDRDIFTVDVEEMREGQVDLTILDGDVVFERAA